MSTPSPKGSPSRPTLARGARRRICRAVEVEALERRSLMSVPPAPTITDSSSPSPSKVDLAWTDVGLPANASPNHYQLSYSTNGGSTWTEWGNVGGHTLAWGISPLPNPGGEYQVRVRAHNADGYSPWSSTVTEWTRPNLPTITGTSATPSSITLNWGDVAGESGYRVYMGRGYDGASGALPDSVMAANTTNKTFTQWANNSANPITPGSTWAFMLFAHHHDDSDMNNAMWPAGWLNVTTPVNVTATSASATQVDVSWDNIAGETGYFLDYSTSSSFPSGSTTTVTVAADDTSEAVSGLSANTKYYFRVRSTNGQAQAVSSNVADAVTRPAAPTLTQADGEGTGQIRIYWSDVGLATHYDPHYFEIQRRPVGGTFETAIAQMGGHTFTWAMTGLATGTNYEFRVRAHNAGGFSDWSNTFAGWTYAQAPNITATAVSSNQINVTWPDVTGEYKYMLLISPNGTWTNYTGIELPANTTSQQLTSWGANQFQPGQTWHFQLRAYAMGYTIAQQTYTDTAPVSATTLPNVPSGLAVSDVSHSSHALDVTWNSAAGATGYKLYRSLDNVNFSLVRTLAQWETYAHDTGLADGTQYYYRVTATNAGGETAPSASASDTTMRAKFFDSLHNGGKPSTPAMHPPTLPDGSDTLSRSVTTGVFWKNNTDLLIDEDTVELSVAKAITNYDANNQNEGNDTIVLDIERAGWVFNINTHSVAQVDATIARMNELITLVRNTAASLRPGLNLKIGVYGEFPLYPPGVHQWNDAQVMQDWRTANDYLYDQAMFDAVDFFAPSYYTPNLLPESWIAGMGDRIALHLEELRRFGKPIYPLIDIAYMNTLASMEPMLRLPTSLFKNQITYLRQHADGFVLWGGGLSWDATEGWWTTLVQEMERTRQAPAPSTGADPAPVITTFNTAGARLTWTDRTSNEDGFLIERSHNGGEFFTVDFLPAGTTTWSDSRIRANGTDQYSYRVVAYNSFGRTQPSAATASSTVTRYALGINNAEYLDHDANGDFIEDGGTGFAGWHAPDPHYGIFTQHDGWVKYEDVDFGAGATQFLGYMINGSNTTAYDEMQIWIDGRTAGTGGTIIGTLKGKSNGAWGGVWDFVSTAVTSTTGVHDVYFVRKGWSEVGRFDFWQFRGGSNAVPAPPNFLTSDTTGLPRTSMKIGWSDFSDDETGFRIYRSTTGINEPTALTLIGTVAAGVTTFTDTNLDPSLKTYYVVRAYNAAGESQNSPQMAVIPASPSFTHPITADGTAAIFMKWTNVGLGTSAADGYEVEVSSDNGATWGNRQLYGGVTYEWWKHNLQPGTNYLVRIRADRGNDYSAWSVPVAAHTESLPPVLSVSADAQDAGDGNTGHIYVTWPDQNTEEGYVIQVSPNNFNSYTPSQGHPTFGVLLEDENTFHFRYWGGEAHTGNKLSPGTVWYLRGRSDPSPVAGDAVAIAFTNPTATVDAGEVVVTWNKAVHFGALTTEVATKYWIERSTSPSMSNPVRTEVSAGLTSYTFDDIPAGTYYFRVRPVVAGALEAFSPVTSGITLLAAPDNFGRVTSSTNPIDLEWSPVTGASHYIVYRWDGSNVDYTHAWGVSVSGLDDEDVVASSTYRYRVTAVVNGVESLRSEELVVNT